MHPFASGHGLMHAVITIEDLDTWQLQSWISHLSDATHMLDVYRGFRIDKHQAYAQRSGYMSGFAGVPISQLVKGMVKGSSALQEVPS